MNLLEQIKRKFLYKPTSEQENALKLLADFLLSPDSDEVFLLKGYAGTGKTSLVSALVKTLDELKQKCCSLLRGVPLRYSRIMRGIPPIPFTGGYTASVLFRTNWIILR